MAYAFGGGVQCQNMDTARLVVDVPSAAENAQGEELEASKQQISQALGNSRDEVATDAPISGDPPASTQRSKQR